MEKSKRFRWREASPDFGAFTGDCFSVGSNATLVGHHLWISGCTGQNPCGFVDLKTNEWHLASCITKGLVFKDHSCVLVNDYILMYGVQVELGYTDVELNRLLKLDIVSTELTMLETYGSGLGEDMIQHFFHVAHFYAKENALVVLKKVLHEGVKLLLLDLPTSTWKDCVMKGRTPQVWTRPGSEIIGSKLFVYGGTGPGNHENALYILDLVNVAWERTALDPCLNNVLRVGPTLTYAGSGRLMVLEKSSLADSLNKLFVIEDACSLRRQSHEVRKNTYNGVGFSYDGSMPRAGLHARMLLVQGKLIVFGGSIPSGRSFSELIAT